VVQKAAAAAAPDQEAGCVGGLDPVLVVRVDAVAQPPQRALGGGADVGRMVRSLGCLRKEVVGEDR
jgi:hypothetical protein